jgi:gas vesicle protein
LCVISTEKECGRAILATEKLAKESAIAVSEQGDKLSSLTHIVEGVVVSLDKLIKKHEQEERETINRLKRRIEEKDEEIKKAAELEAAKQWQIKMALFVAVLGFISAFVLLLIKFIQL